MTGNLQYIEEVFFLARRGLIEESKTDRAGVGEEIHASQRTSCRQGDGVLRCYMSPPGDY